MAKVVLGSLSGGYGHLDILNDNFSRLATALENTLSRDGTTPNAMGATLDMNSNRIINLPEPVDNTDAARYQDVMDAALPTQTGLVNYVLKTDGSQPDWTNRLLMGDGTSAAPAYSFSAQTNSGFYRDASTRGVWAYGGEGRIGFGNDLILHSTSALYWGATDAVSGVDVGLFRDGANVLAQRNSNNPQGFMLYNTFTDASNHEKLAINWSANEAFIQTTQIGTGQPRNLVIGTVGAGVLEFFTNSARLWRMSGAGLLAYTDNAYDIGQPGTNRPRHVYVAGSTIADGYVRTNTYFHAEAAGVAAYLKRSGGGDVARLLPLAAGNGFLIDVVNNAESDYEPFTVFAENFQINCRNGVGSTAAIVQFSTSGLLFNSDNAYDIGGSAANRPRSIYAGTGVTVDTGRWYSNTSNYFAKTGSWDVFRISHNPAGSGINLDSVDPTGSASYEPMYINADGINLNSQTTAGVGLGTSGGTQFLVTNTASAVNYVSATGGATGVGVTLSAQGSDTNIHMHYASKGTGAHGFYTNGLTNLQFSVTHTANAVNYLYVTGAVTTNWPRMEAVGSDTNIGIYHITKGSGWHSFMTNSGNEQFRVSHTASAVNYINVSGRATGNGPILNTVGTDTNIDLIVSTKGSGGFGVFTNNSAQKQFEVIHTASAVNWVRTTGGATGASPTISAQGSDSNINIVVQGKGTGTLLTTVADQANLQIVTASVPSAAGGTGGVGIYGSGGEYLAYFRRAGGSGELLQMQGIHSSIVQMNLGGGASGALSQGILLQTDNAVTQLHIVSTVSAVNYMQITGAVTTGSPSIQVVGSDTNIDLALITKGTGVVKFGTHTGSGDTAISGYITIKDAGGTTRKLAVIT